MQYYNLAETMPKCYVLSDFTWHTVHDKQSVLQVQGHTAVVVPPLGVVSHDGCGQS